jgi:hypothetical protein
MQLVRSNTRPSRFLPVPFFDAKFETRLHLCGLNCLMPSVSDALATAVEAKQVERATLLDHQAL